MWSKKRASVSFTPRKLVRPTLLLKRRTPTVDRSSSSNIKVVVRVRPQNEKDSTCRQVIQVVDDQCLIFDPKEGENEFYVGGHKQLNRDMLKKRHKNIEFQFDHVFDDSSSNADVFEGTTQNLILSLLDGFNCSVFVYGATGAGKTYTMLGSKETPGIAYLTMVELYKQMEDIEKDNKFELKISYLEVYNETVKDLICPSGPLNLRDDGKEGIIISGIKTHQIGSADELFQMLERGNKNRTQHPTDANAESSRSHAVFQVHLNITHKLSMETKTSKLTMIDLAGSERGGVTGGKGARFSEGSNINKSLLALGNCVDALAEGHKHIPYRNSKLTRILKDSLGGNCKTVMIVNVAPSNLSYEETFNTLNYANRAKKINNKARRNLVNVDMPASQYRKIIDELKRRNLELENENKAIKENNSFPKPEYIPRNLSEKSSYNSDIESGREVLRCCYELEEKYRREILLYQMKIKTLDWRIYQKKVISERFKFFEYIVGDHKINSKMDETTRKLKLQRNTFKDKIKCLQKLLKEKIDMREIALKEIQEKGILGELQRDIDLYVNKMNREATSSEVGYFKDLLLKQQNEMTSSDKIINLLCKNMDYYYSVLKGSGRVSEQMEKEYLHLVQQLAGIKGVSWQDETCDYNILRKIIDLSFSSDISSNTSPAVIPTSENNEIEVIGKVDTCPPENDDIFLPTTSLEPCNLQKPLVDKFTPRKFSSKLSVVEECSTPNESPVIVKTSNVSYCIPSTPSVGLQCIAEYLSPEETIYINGDTLKFSEKSSLILVPETPVNNYLNKTYTNTFSQLEDKTDRPDTMLSDSLLKQNFDKTFFVPQLQCDNVNQVSVSAERRVLKVPDTLNEESAPLNRTFTSDSSQGSVEGSFSKIPDTLLCEGNTAGPLNRTFTSDTSQEYYSKSPENANDSVVKASVLNCTFTSENSQIDIHCDPIADNSNAPEKKSFTIGNNTFISNYFGIKGVNSEGIIVANTSVSSCGELNLTFTSKSPQIVEESEPDGDCDVCQKMSIPNLNQTFSDDHIQMKDGLISEENIDCNVEYVPATHAMSNDLTPKPVTSQMVSTFVPISDDQDFIGKGAASVCNEDGISLACCTFSSASQPNENGCKLVDARIVRKGVDSSKSSLPLLSASISPNTFEVAGQPGFKSCLPPKITKSVKIKTITSPGIKTKTTTSKISSVRKNAQLSGNISRFPVKNRNVSNGNHVPVAYPADNQIHISNGLRIKPSATVKIHFNPLTERNKLHLISAKGTLAKADPDYLKKKPSPLFSKTNLKENKIPVPSRIITPRMQSKFNGAKEIKPPSYMSKKS